MNLNLIKCCAALTVIILINSCSPKIASTGTVKVNRWEKYDNSSMCAASAITSAQIQGLWKAYEGELKFDGLENTMNLFKPITIEVKDSLSRRSQTSPFIKYQLNQNMIITHDGGRADTGIINKITAKQFTITWKEGANYTRYYYTK